MSSEMMPAPSKPDVASASGQLFRPKLIPRLREALRLRRYSLKTEKA